MRRGLATCALALVASLVLTFASADALADESIETLQQQQQDDLAALSTQDCVIACKALASIRRAADRICALESGPRCIDARSKADDAQKRVQAACPDCQLAANKPKDEERRANEPGTGAGAEAHKPAMTKAAPPSERGRRGCGSCSTPGPTEPGDLGLFVFAAFALARRLRARSRRVR